ncbi:uncharacterized protein LOC100367433 [Saccoglossus kowalevskii]|uniref:Plasminogen-like n=1 Tax=Saccoglossus kowalevskii TaxID=10224 RepID=A0ABM0GW56_SACKO|nr:PREDICTED: plasminogen-like [Saccoglossus kowalevskii]
MVRRETIVFLLIVLVQFSAQAVVSDAKNDKTTKPEHVNTTNTIEAVVDDVNEELTESRNVNSLEGTEEVGNEDAINISHYNPYPSDGSECYVLPDASDYRGTVSMTENGRTCQKWSEQSPHQHTIIPNNYQSSGIGDHNYCRNPDGSSRTWCFTMDVNTRWEYCDVGTKQNTCLAGTNAGGVVFTRWGHNACPGSTVVVYSGTMAGKYYNNYGSGGNYLCLPKIPKYDLDVIDAGSESDRGRLYPVEYRAATGPLSSSMYDDVPCAVCLDEYRSTSILYPARDDCPSGWTREYYGFLMSARYDTTSYYSTEYVCVDAAGKAIPGTSASSSTSWIYTVEATCVTGGGIACDPYVTGYELSCAVCAK